MFVRCNSGTLPFVSGYLRKQGRVKLLGRNANELGANKNSSKPPITESMQITAFACQVAPGPE